MSRKLTAIGLIFYVLILLIQPCEDVFAREQALDDCNAATLIIENHVEGGCESETCLPFCICSCCSPAIAHPPFTTNITVYSAADVRPSPVARYRNPYDITFDTNIWQPPKA